MKLHQQFEHFYLTGSDDNLNYVQPTITAHQVRGISFSSSIKGVFTVITTYLIIGRINIVFKLIKLSSQFPSNYNLNFMTQ